MEPTRSKAAQRRLAGELKTYLQEAERSRPVPAPEPIHPAQVQRAKEIQSHLFPATTTQVGQWDLAFEWQPSSAVGGDLCWYSETPKHLLVALVDVMGHGYPAAIIVGMMAAVLEGVVELSEETLQSINSFLSEKTPKDTSVALTLVQVEPESGKALLCCAGNPKPIFLGSSLDKTYEGVETQPAMGGWRVTLRPRVDHTGAGPDTGVPHR